MAEGAFDKKQAEFVGKLGLCVLVVIILIAVFL